MLGWDERWTAMVWPDQHAPTGEGGGGFGSWWGSPGTRRFVALLLALEILVLVIVFVAGSGAWLLVLGAAAVVAVVSLTVHQLRRGS